MSGLLSVVVSGDGIRLAFFHCMFCKSVTMNVYYFCNEIKVWLEKIFNEIMYYNDYSNVKYILPSILG